MNARTLEVVYRPTADLIPYARNARTHSTAQVEEIAASIREFGFTNPILIDEDDGIVAGHGRVLAAATMLMEQVPTITLTGLTDAQRRAYVLADNKLALNAGWDQELLSLEVSELADMHFETGLLGWPETEMDVMTGNVPTTGFPALGDGEAPTHGEMNFILHQSQVDTVKAAVHHAKEAGHGASKLNKNGNGNALAHICAAYMKTNA